MSVAWTKSAVKPDALQGPLQGSLLVSSFPFRLGRVLLRILTRPPSLAFPGRDSNLLPILPILHCGGLWRTVAHLFVTEARK